MDKLVIPPIFSDLTRRQFFAIRRQVPRGNRLYDTNGCWREALYVRRFLDLVAKRKTNLLALHCVHWLKSDLGEKLEGRHLRVCLGIVRWFGTNCGRAWLDQLIDSPLWEDSPFYDAWDGYGLRRITLGGQFHTTEQYQITLDGLLNEAICGERPTDSANHVDRAVSTAFFRWLDDSRGYEFLIDIRCEVAERLKKEDLEMRTKLFAPGIEKKVSEFREKLYKDAHIPLDGDEDTEQVVN